MHGGDQDRRGLRGDRPDITGQGLGLEFFGAGLAFSREHYRPGQVFLHVASFNERARRLLERAGFRVVSSHVRSFEKFGEVVFLTMAEERAEIVPHRHRTRWLPGGWLGDQLVERQTDPELRPDLDRPVDGTIDEP